MTAHTGILAFGAYIPERRLQRTAIHAANAWFAPALKSLAKGERATASWDEDSITLAVEAARDCLSEFDRTSVSSLTLASTTLPFADRLNAGVVKEALVLPDQVAAVDLTGSQRAGTSALIQALQAPSRHLVLASELRRPRPGSESEMLYGDAGGAILTGSGQVIARYLGSYTVTVDFIDHFRASGANFDYGWEGRWVRDEGHTKILGGALQAALSKFGVAGSDIDRAIIPVSVQGVPESLAKAAGIRAEAVCNTLAAAVGDSGAAHPLLMLAAALENAKPGEKLLLAGFGQGADILLFETTDALTRLPPRLGVSGHLTRARKDSNYMRYLFHRGLLDLERGMRAEIDQKQPFSTLYRNRKTVLGLVGSRCTSTGTVQFPKSEIGVNAGSGTSGTRVEHPLADRLAKIVTYTADYLSYSPDPPVFYGAIDFDGGGRLVAEFADCTAADVEVGRAMRMVFRIKSFDALRDFTRYFWKAVPLKRGEA